MLNLFQHLSSRVALDPERNSPKESFVQDADLLFPFGTPSKFFLLNFI